MLTDNEKYDIQYYDNVYGPFGVMRTARSLKRAKEIALEMVDAYKESYDILRWLKHEDGSLEVVVVEPHGGEITDYSVTIKKRG